MKKKMAEIGAKAGLEKKETGSITRVGITGLLALTLSTLAAAAGAVGPDAQTQAGTRQEAGEQASGKERCSLKPERGPCKALFRKFYFDEKSGKCKSFSYGGCEGVVPFETFKECVTTCVPGGQQSLDAVVPDSNDSCGPFPGYPCGTKYYTVSLVDFGL